tara:strand:+ start:104 stop:1153 length:1050 start_codon:yes stop_codon:yes gene_type:complete
MINIDDHFDKGTEGYVMASRALSQINAARGAGLEDQANELESGFEQAILSLRRSGGQDASGFKMYLKEAEGLAKTASSVAKGQNELGKVISRLNVSHDEIKRLGGNIPKQNVDAIQNAAKSGDVNVLNAQLKLMDDSLAAKISETAKLNTPEAQKFRAETAAVDATKKRTLTIIDKYVNSKGNPTETLRSATGVGEGVGRWIGGITEGVIGTSTGVMSNQDELVRDIRTDDVLKTVQLLKPASNTDVDTITKTRPSITDSPEQWASYLNSMKNVLSQDIDRAKLSGEATQVAPSQGGTQTQPPSTDQSDPSLRVRNIALEVSEKARQAREEEARKKQAQSQLPPPEGFR